MNLKLKKLLALSMAILSLGSGANSIVNKNLDFTPKISAKSPAKFIPTFTEAMRDEEFSSRVSKILDGLTLNDLKNNRKASPQLDSKKYQIATAYSDYILKCNNIVCEKVCDTSYCELFESKKFVENIEDTLGEETIDIVLNTFLSKLNSYSAFDDFKLIQTLGKSSGKALTSILLMGLAMSSNTVRTFLKDGINIANYEFNKICNKYIYNHFKLNQDPVKLKRIIDECLQEKVLCQDNAIHRISNIISGMADNWRESDCTGTPCTSACTMTFMGDSGVGKTYAARALSKALYHKDMQPWQFITSTSVTSSNVSTSNSSNLSPADQIFNEKSELIRQLRLNNKVIVVLDEIDKMHKIDTDDTILERLRDARDTGKLLVRSGVNYDYVDVSRTVFICITNEARECWGLPKEDLSEIKSASRTHILRDKSLVNRFDIVEFKYFTVEDYMSMLTPMVESLKEYVKSYNLNLDADEDLIRKISEAAETKNKGARGLNDYLVLLRGQLVAYRDKNEEELKKDIHKIEINYDEKTDDFEIIKCD